MSNQVEDTPLNPESADDEDTDDEGMNDADDVSFDPHLWHARTREEFCSEHLKYFKDSRLMILGEEACRNLECKGGYCNFSCALLYEQRLPFIDRGVPPPPLPHITITRTHCTEFTNDEIEGATGIPYTKS